MKTSQASSPRRQGLRYCPEQAEPLSTSPSLPVLVAAIDPTAAGSGAGIAPPSLRGAEPSDALGEGRIRAPPLPAALGFGYRHRSPGDFCFVFLGVSRLDALRAGSCSPLCRWEHKISAGESIQLRGSHSCTWGGWTEKLLSLSSSSHPLPGRHPSASLRTLSQPRCSSSTKQSRGRRGEQSTESNALQMLPLNFSSSLFLQLVYVLVEFCHLKNTRTSVMEGENIPPVGR